MSQYYKGKRVNNVYKPGDPLPFRISRSKIDSFLNCPRCFYLDVRLGIAQPPGYPFTLNSAVDLLFKKEFDIHRKKHEPHPLMKTYGIDAIPLDHEKMDEWREARRAGIQFLHKPTNLLITGGIDDVWVNPQREYIIVDYKSTAKTSEVTIDQDWQIGYKRQMEVYQWLFRMNGFRVSQTGYFVYANGRTDRQAFDGKLEFDVTILPYKGDDSWVEGTIRDIKLCLESPTVPDSKSDCDYCAYRNATQAIHTSNNPQQQLL